MNSPEGIRLNKYLASCGVGSRRACDTLVQQGEVVINGEVCLNPGYRVQPGDFITIAEESGLVIEVDHFVLRQAVREMGQWNEDHGTELSISVNLSAIHFNSERIVGVVEDALWQSRIRPDLLTLEITETMVLNDRGNAHAVIDHLQQIPDIR